MRGSLPRRVAAAAAAGPAVARPSRHAGRAAVARCSRQPERGAVRGASRLCRVRRRAGRRGAVRRGLAATPSGCTPHSLCVRGSLTKGGVAPTFFRRIFFKTSIRGVFSGGEQRQGGVQGAPTPVLKQFGRVCAGASPVVASGRLLPALCYSASLYHGRSFRACACRVRACSCMGSRAACGVLNLLPKACLWCVAVRCAVAGSLEAPGYW